MNFNIIWYCILLFIGYKFVTKIVWPIIKTFLVVRTKFNSIKNQFNAAANNVNEDSIPQNKASKKDGTIKVKSEYIDFEDLK